AYLGILFSTIYYLFWRPLFRHDAENNDAHFTVPERAVLLGILAGYFIHNLVVFDNIVSYMFFAIILGLIHSQIGREMPKVQAFEIDPKIVSSIALPVVVVCMGTII